jgi:hypothetical protein
LPKDKAAILKRQMSVISRKVQKSQWMLFVWRCFGDGVAFAYLDKWAIKQVFLNLHNAEKKQDAGFITGKDGLSREVELLRHAVSAGVPCLLTDLTNCIRYGDVCVLVGPDPVLFEVKSSRNTNLRTDRQLDSLKSIHRFLQTDEAIGLRGFPVIKRVEHAVHERNYLDILDQAMQSALAENVFVADLERGTRLMAIANVGEPDYSALFAEMERPFAFILNTAKNEQTWGCYYPFTLSIRDPQNLYAFLRGDVIVIVAFDFSQIEYRAAEQGFSCSLLNEESYAIEFTYPIDGLEPKFVAKMSTHLTNRVAFELLSWEWILEDLRAQMVRQHAPGFESDAEPSRD